MTRWRLRAGERVSVSPDDYGKVPVIGDLVTLSWMRSRCFAKMSASARW